MDDLIRNAFERIRWHRKTLMCMRHRWPQMPGPLGFYSVAQPVKRQIRATPDSPSVIQMNDMLASLTEIGGRWTT